MMIATFQRELGQALRRGLHRPLSTCTIILLLVLGIAPFATLVSALLAVVDGRLPFHDAQRLVYIQMRSDKLALELGPSEPIRAALREDVPSIVASGSFVRASAAITDASGRLSDEIRIVRADPGALAVLQSGLAQGDLSVLAEAEAARPALLLTWSYWQRAFGGRDVVGQSLRVNADDLRIDGILPDGFAFPSRDIDAWLVARKPLQRGSAAQAADFGDQTMIARLRPDAALADASRELGLLLRNDPAVAPVATEAGLRLEPKPLRMLWVRDGGTTLATLLAAALGLFGVVLANALGLFALQAWSRRQEIALVQCLGATPRDMRYRLAADALLPCVAGAVLALPVVWLLFRALPAHGLLPEDMPGADSAVSVAIAVVLASAAVAFAAMTVGASLIHRVAAAESLAMSARAVVDNPRGKALRAGLVATQLAASFVVAYLALLLSQNVDRLLAQDLGVDRAHAAVARVDAFRQAGGSDEIPRRRAELAAWLDAVRALPGVTAAALASAAPLGDTVLVDRYSFGSGAGVGDQPFASFWYVGADYFRALGVRVLRGRTFSLAEARDSRPVVVIDRVVANTQFGERDPIGASIDVPGPDGARMGATVIGVVDRVRQRALRAEDEYPSIYLPSEVPYRLEAVPTDQLELVVGGPDGALPAAAVLAAGLRSASAGFRLQSVEGIDERARGTVTDLLRLRDWLAFVSWIVAVLSVAGLYALFAGRVAAAQPEFGVRKAIGATPASIFLGVMRASAALAAASLLLGLPIAAVAGAAVARALDQPGTFSPMLLVAIAGAVLILSAAAVIAPALRAARADPIQCLRAL